MKLRNVLALLLAVLMLCALCACGDTAEETTAPAAEPAETEAAETEAAAPEGEQPAAPPEGEGSGEASSNPGGATMVEPDASYSKDFAGYVQYVTDAYATDEHAPEDQKESTNAALAAAADENDETIAMLVDVGLVCSYEEFLAK